MAAVVEGAETQQALLQPVIEAYAERMRQEPEVQAMLEQADKYRTRKSPVADLGPARKRRASKRAKDPSTVPSADTASDLD